MNADDKPTFKIVIHGSNEYRRIVDLRDEILRKPLGLSSSSEELDLEKDYIHVAGFVGGLLCATVMLIPKLDELIMQRVAIREDFQGKGIGSAMMSFIEKYAKEHGFKSIYCHARDTAVPFYEKNGYIVEGDSFFEIGIIHYAMRKKIY